MAKKPKTPHKDAKSNNNPKSNEGSNPSCIFKTLFGNVSDQIPASDSLFSDNNPFRRKPAQTHLQNQGLELGFAEKNAQFEANLRDVIVSEKKKRKKNGAGEEILDLDDGFDEEKVKKFKRGELKENGKSGISELGSGSSGNGDLVVRKSKGVELEGNEKGGNSGISGSGDLGVKSEKKKKRKRKRDEVETEYEAKRYGVGDEVMAEDRREGGVVGEKRKKMDNPEDMMVSKEGFDDESKLLRTVFVGNLPLKLKKKEIVKEFGQFGEVESVRIRSVPIVDGKIPRKGAVIKKRINENGDSVNAYVVFKTEESARASLAHNMAVVGGNHIRVDRACPPRKKLKEDKSTLYDNKRTVFVGNLPFDVKDEEIYKLFCSIKNFETSVEAVRVIRDPGTSLGKGIAYVLFKTTDAARMIVKKRNVKLRDRELRLNPAQSTDTTPLKRKNSSQPQQINSSSSKKLLVASRTPDRVNNFKAGPNLSYQGLRASKSGAQKKAHTRINLAMKSKPQSNTTSTEQKSGKKKRPSVAARKEKAKQATDTSQLAGKKRKLGNRTPDSDGRKKRAKKFR